MEEQINREWKRFGHHDREWTKIFMIYFDEDNKPQLIKITDYKLMNKEKEKQKMLKAAKAMKDKDYLKHAKQDKLKVIECLSKALERFDEKELDEAEKDCCMCLNLMIESCILPCRHRFCVQCMKEHLNYGDKCPICRHPVPNFFKAQYYFANIDKNYLKYCKRKFPAEYEA